MVLNESDIRQASRAGEAGINRSKKRWLQATNVAENLVVGANTDMPLGEKKPLFRGVIFLDFD